MSISDAPLAETTQDFAPRSRVNYWGMASRVVRSQAFVLGLALCAAIVLCYWPLFVHTASLFLQPESYYSHVVIIPFMSAYLVYDRWGSMKNIPVKPVTWIVALLPLLIYTDYIVSQSPRNLVLSILLVATLLASVIFVAGWRWMRALFAPITFLLFGLPIWEQVIDVYTQPLQRVSSSLSYAVLQAVGFHPYQADETTILMDHFQMYVGVPCSGLRTVLAVAALSVYIVMIGRMKLWANLVLLGLAIPLAVAINGLRISMIGAVGETMGQEAGMKFHDTSGHIAIVVLVVSLWYIAKGLGMK